MGPDLVDQLHEIGERIALDVELDGTVVFGRQHVRQFGDITAPDMALIRAGMDCHPVSASVDDRSRRVENARPPGIALIAQQRDLVEINAELGHDRSPPKYEPPCPGS